MNFVCVGVALFVLCKTVPDTLKPCFEDLTWLLHVFHRQVAHLVSGTRYQAKEKKRTWPTPSWLRYQAKNKNRTWLTPTLLRYQEKTWLRYQAKKI